MPQTSAEVSPKIPGVGMVVLSVLLISADLDELMRLSDRLVTVFEGKVTGRFRTADVTREEIGYYMTGGRQDTTEAEAR